MKIRAFRGETVTLATTVAFPQTKGIPPGMNNLQVHAPSATLENISLILTPKIVKLWYYDDSATTKYVDLTSALTDRNTSTGTGSSLNSFATADFIYFGCDNRFRGLSVDVTNTNGTASAATVEYWNGTAWTSITVTDTTESPGGTPLGQDGLLSWTVPTDWVRTSVNSEPRTLYWVRYKVSVALDATVSIVEVSTLANTVLNSADTNAEGYDYILLRSNNDTLIPFWFNFDSDKFGGVELKSASITSTANLTWYNTA